MKVDKNFDRGARRANNNKKKVYIVLCDDIQNSNELKLKYKCFTSKWHRLRSILSSN